MQQQIGFIGLGNQGLPMATNLVNAGYSLRVYNRTASKAECGGLSAQTADVRRDFRYDGCTDIAPSLRLTATH